MQISSSKFDIIIVGGGMVGLAMAAALADTKLSIAVVEKHQFDALTHNHYLSSQEPLPDEFDIRVSAISSGNQNFLSQLNCWQNLPVCRIADFEQMQVWDCDGSGSINFDAAEVAQLKLGSIVENQALRAAIYKSVATFGNIQLITDMEIDSINSRENCVEICFTDSTIISAKLLIGADGAQSCVREKLYIQTAEKAYEQIAFVANVHTELSHQNTAWQRFTGSGPVAFLPLPNKHLCSVVWSIDKAKAKMTADLTPQDFAERLGCAFEHRLGQVKIVSGFQSFPLIKRHAQSYLADRCVLIGDAAHTIHPLAGQGVNLGFQDVACLSKQIHLSLSRGRDYSLKANLRAFERERKAENTLMQEAMSGFKHLFGQQNLPAILFRNWVLNVADKSGIVKQAIIQRTMGLL